MLSKTGKHNPVVWQHKNYYWRNLRIGFGGSKLDIVGAVCKFSAHGSVTRIYVTTTIPKHGGKTLGRYLRVFYDVVGDYGNSWRSSRFWDALSHSTTQGLSARFL
jgi:hypothetical protein